MCAKDTFRDLKRGKRCWGRPSRYRPRGRPVEEGRHRVRLSRFRFWSKTLGLSHHVPDFCTKSRFSVYSVYVVIFTCQYYWLLCRSLSLYLYLITLLEWETGSPSRTRFFGGRLRRSRDRIFIVQDGGFGLKNGFRQNPSKKRLPEVEEAASGRGFLAVLDVVLYHRPEASGVSGLGHVPGQVGGALQRGDGAIPKAHQTL